MNVLYVCADRGIPVLGGKGASVHVRSLATAMHDLGHRVTLAARSWGDANPAPRAHRLESLHADTDHAALQLEALIREERPEVVIERYSLESAAARRATRNRGVPLLLEVNAPLVEEATRYRALDDPTAARREHHTLRQADRIQVVSSALLRYVRSVAPSVPSEWIPNGADVARLRGARPASHSGLAGRTVVGFVGSMKPWHGVEQLLDAFAQVRPAHPEAVLVLVGAGPREAEVIERANRAGLRGSLVHAGQTPHAEVPSLIARFDVAVAPYLAVERFYFHPLKVVEYLAAGRAVIYADQGDLGELVGSGGLGYAPGSIDQLADRLALVLGDLALRRELAACAAARGARLDWSVIAERVTRFAAGPADGRRGAPALPGAGSS
jgi:glycosyltransferase involved in cell wall biosynthesis